MIRQNITFQIVCPAGQPTGGIELLHQMALILAQEGHKVDMFYWPKTQNHKLTDFYSNYLEDVKVVNNISDNRNTIIILPEVYSYFIKKIKKSNILFWWLSVDNYINSKKIRFAMSNNFIPLSYWNIKKDKNIMHAVQSEYAKSYLEKHQIEADYFISDYINDEYFSDFSQAQNCLPKNRENIILYNPAKGGSEQKKLIEFLENKYQCIPLKGFNQESMIKILGKAKVYIDFGEHPGKDRIPREAAILGCCIITNKKGSAENNIDIPIPREYKFEQESNYFKDVDNKISKIFNNFEYENSKLEIYRKKIKDEKELFIQAVKLFGKSF